MLPYQPLLSTLQAICSFIPAQINFQALNNTLPYGCKPSPAAALTASVATAQSSFTPNAAHPQATDAQPHQHDSSNFTGEIFDSALNGAAEKTETGGFSEDAQFKDPHLRLPAHPEEPDPNVKVAVTSQAVDPAKISDTTASPFTAVADHKLPPLLPSLTSATLQDTVADLAVMKARIREGRPLPYDAVLFFHGLNGLELACESGRLSPGTCVLFNGASLLLEDSADYLSGEEASVEIDGSSVQHLA